MVFGVGCRSHWRRWKFCFWGSALVRRDIRAWQSIWTYVGIFTRLSKQEKDEKSCCLQWFLDWEWETGCETALTLSSNCVPREPFCLSALAFTAALVASHLLCLPSTWISQVKPDISPVYLQACSNSSSLAYRNGMRLIITQRVLRKLFSKWENQLAALYCQVSLGETNRSNKRIWFLSDQLCTLTWTSTVVNFSGSFLCELCRIKQLH